MSKIYGLCFIVLFLAAFTACTPKNPAAAGLVPASGTISLDGTPIGGAMITFHNIDDEKKPGGSAISKPDGTFSLNMFAEGDGTYPGKYCVTVSKVEITYPISDEELLKLEAAGKDIPAGKKSETFPPKYQAIASSDLNVTIPEKGIKDLKLEATSK